MALPPISDEQRYAVTQPNNIVIDSVAGCGKTTTNLYIAQMSKLPTLLLTYNRKLRMETMERAEKLMLGNLEVHTFHSFCHRYYGPCPTDSHIKRLLRKKVEPFSYKIVILDETQDMTPLYFELVCKIMADMVEPPRICVLGDKNQSIYDFNNADSRFITMAPFLFRFNDLSWSRCKLTKSFRITREMAQFVNCMMGYERISSDKRGSRPRYIVCNAFNARRAWEEVKMYIDMGYAYQDIFILAASVKQSPGKRKPIRLLANKLADENIPIFVPNSDEGRLDQSVLDGKIVFSTFHQAKGLERKVVIVFGFDASYFKFFKRDLNPATCPNELYVAVTRGLEHLTLIQQADSEPLEFLGDFKDICYYEDCKRRKESPKKEKRVVSVTELVKYIPSSVVEECLERVKIKPIRVGKSLSIPTKTQQKFGYEGVSEITGTGIPAYYEFINGGSMTIYDSLIALEKANPTWIRDNVAAKEVEVSPKCAMCWDSDSDSSDSSSDDEFEKVPASAVDLASLTAENLMYLAGLYTAYASGFKFKMAQMNRFDWLTEKNLNRCMRRMKKLNLKEARFEVEMQGDAPYGKVIAGRADCVDGKRLFEFKCAEVQDEHILQLIVYMWLTNITTGEVPRSFLFNILSDELIRVSCAPEDLKWIVDRLMLEKYGDRSKVDDATFIKRAGRVVAKYQRMGADDGTKKGLAGRD